MEAEGGRAPGEGVESMVTCPYMVIRSRLEGGRALGEASRRDEGTPPPVESSDPLFVAGSTERAGAFRQREWPCVAPYGPGTAAPPSYPT